MAKPYLKNKVLCKKYLNVLLLWQTPVFVCKYILPNGQLLVGMKKTSGVSSGGTGCSVQSLGGVPHFCLDSSIFFSLVYVHSISFPKFKETFDHS